VREAGIAWFPEIELAVLYLAAAIVLLVRLPGSSGGREYAGRRGVRDRARDRIAPSRLPLGPAGAVILLVVPWMSRSTRRSCSVRAHHGDRALGFNLLLGYTDSLVRPLCVLRGGAYVVALMVKYLRVGSMELFCSGRSSGR